MIARCILPKYNYVFGCTGGDDVTCMTTEDDLNFWALLNNCLHISRQTVLQLRVQMCFRFLDHNRYMEHVGEEGILDGGGLGVRLYYDFLRRGLAFFSRVFDLIRNRGRVRNG